LTVIFLETAELRAKNRQQITMSFWKENVDRILEMNDQEILRGAGSISNKQMEDQVSAIYNEFDKKRKRYEADQADLHELDELEKTIKSKKK